MVYGPTDDNPSASWVLAAAPLFDVEVQQFTGLFDKEGKEIYEGDIVILGWSTSDVHWSGSKAEVVWWNNGFYFQHIPSKSLAQDTYYQFKECKVIGNIHENGELLK